MLMNKINIEELHPGEAALSANKVAKFLEALTNGNELAPVKVTNLEGSWGVRDGNNRVRPTRNLASLTGPHRKFPVKKFHLGQRSFLRGKDYEGESNIIASSAVMDR
jgi:hypothetical protein